MDQGDFFRPRIKKVRNVHDNIYIAPDKLKKLNHLRMIDKEKFNAIVRRAAESAIESEWRKLCAVSGQEPDLGF